MSAILELVLARARRRPWRWLAPGVGIALVVAFAGAVWAQAQIAGSQAARAALAGLRPVDRAVRVTWEGPITADAQARALFALRAVGLPRPTAVTLLNPVRLDGVIVRPAGIAPLSAWTASARVAACRPARCPMLLAGGSLGATVLRTDGARLVVVGRAELRSAAPLGFVPEAGSGEFPLLVTGDAAGLDALPGLSGVFRTHGWVSELSTASLTSWQITALQRRLRQAQAVLQAASPQFSFTAPFAALDAARASAQTGPRRLLLAGGAAAATLVLFIVLSAASLRHDQERELARLELAGARRRHRWLFVVVEASWMSGVAAVLGALVAIAAAIALARAAHVPATGALTHSLLTPAGALALSLGWLLAGGLLCAAALAPGTGAPDALALGAALALVATIATGSRDSGTAALAMAPLACLAAGVVVYRVAGRLTALGERALRSGPVLGRLAMIGLARSPAAPAMAIAFVALSTGLGGFALVYRATLLRSASDQAAQQVPLDAIVAATPAFTRPLSLAPLTRWRRLADGTAWPVRRTEASFVSGGASVTVPALGVPASALPVLRGWPATHASASASVLGHRLAATGPLRTPGPILPGASRWLSLQALSPGLDVDVTAALRAPDGTVRLLDLGVAGPQVRMLRARVPRGRWEVQAFELSEPSGLQVTNGHQNAENPAAATQATVPVTLGPLQALAPDGRPLATARLGDWRGAGSARTQRADEPSVQVEFLLSGLTTVLRPPQPSDSRPVPVLTDPATAAAAGSGRRLGLEVDGLPVAARVVGVLDRFPSVAPGSAGFVVADQASLASALEAQMPGQGRPDELWVSTPHLARLRSALAAGPLSALTTTYRADVQHSLRQAPVARAVMITLLGAAGLCVTLAALGLLVALLGPLRDRALEADLFAQGLGPRGLRAQMRLRMGFAAAIGVACGLIVALALGRLAVAVVQAAGSVAAPDPPLTAVAPAPLLAGWGLAALLALIGAGWLASQALGPRSGR